MTQQARSSGADSGSNGTARMLKASAIAGGAAAAGVVGGMALARKGPSKILGVRMPTTSGSQAVSQNLAEAAKQVGSFGERVGELATEIRLVREGVSNTHTRSPIEVVLQGLTSRSKP